MLQKNTIYHKILNVAPTPVKKVICQKNIEDPRQKISYLVFLDMLQLLKM